MLKIAFPSFLLLAGTMTAASASSPLDNLITTYNQTGPSSLAWVNCGATATQEGCFSSGSLGRLSHVCAIMEGAPTVVTNTAAVYRETRPLYVMNAGTAANGASLNVYKKVDTLANGYDTTTIAFVSQTPLPVVGGVHVACYMAGNAAALFVGTNLSPGVTRVTLADMSIFTLGGFSNAPDVSSITGSDKGFVAATFGSGANTGFYVFGPDGSLTSDGGGGAVVINENQGLPLNPALAPAAAQIVAHHAFRPADAAK